MVFILKDICANCIFFYMSSYEDTIAYHLINKIPDSLQVSETV